MGFAQWIMSLAALSKRPVWQRWYWIEITTPMPESRFVPSKEQRKAFANMREMKLKSFS